VGAYAGILGISIVFFAWPYVFPIDPLRAKLDGVLLAAFQETQVLKADVTSFKEMAELKAKGAPIEAGTYAEGPAIREGSALKQLLADGELYHRLSAPMQERLPKFLDIRNKLLSALGRTKPDLTQLGLCHYWFGNWRLRWIASTWNVSCEQEKSIQKNMRTFSMASLSCKLGKCRFTPKKIKS
jgi:hypothetical protein